MANQLSFSRLKIMALVSPVVGKWREPGAQQFLGDEESGLGVRSVDSRKWCANDLRGQIGIRARSNAESNRVVSWRRYRDVLCQFPPRSQQQIDWFLQFRTGIRQCWVGQRQRLASQQVCLSHIAQCRCQISTRLIQGCSGRYCARKIQNLTKTHALFPLVNRLVNQHRMLQLINLDRPYSTIHQTFRQRSNRRVTVNPSHSTLRILFPHGCRAPKSARFGRQEPPRQCVSRQSLFVPGEHYQVLQTTLRTRFPNQTWIVVTICNGWQPGYLPPASKFGYGIYQEQIAVTSAGSAEIVIETISRAIRLDS
jgi:hypothetical protein